MRRLVTLLFLFATITAAWCQADKRLALVIGNSHYQNSGALKNPVNDARAMASTLQSLGFEVMKYEDVTQAQMKQAINAFGTKLKGYQVGLFYYAGHGIQAKGSNFMVPVEVQLENEESVELDCVAADRVLAFMETAAAKVNLIILDACRNNPFERSWARSTNGNGLALMNAPKGSLIAYATSPGRTASDGDASNGLYTSALLKFIRNQDLTIEQVFKHVRNEVSDKSGGAQIPWETTSLTGEDFYIGKGKPVAGATTAAVTLGSVSGNTPSKGREVNVNAKVSPEDKAQAEIYFNQGKLNYDKYEYERGIVDFDKAIKLNPAYADAFYWRGNCYYGLKNYDRAIEDYNATIEIKSNYTEAYYWRGNAHFGVRQDDKAIDDYTKAITQRPDYAEAFYWRGRTHYELTQDDKALKDLDKAIQLRPDYSEAIFWRGQVHYAGNRFEQAIADYSSALNLKPNDPEVYYWRANSYFSLKDYQKASADFGSAIRLKPEYPEAYFYRGKVRYNQQMYNEALEDFRRASEYKANYADAFYWQGVTLYSLNLDDQVIESMTKALEINPQHSDALYYRGLSRYALKTYEESIADFDQSIQIKPAADAYYWRGQGKISLQNYADAIPDFSKSLEMDPNSKSAPNYYYYRGQAYFGLQMDAYAVKDFTQALTLKPDYADAWYYRACSNLYQGFKEQSLSDLNQAISLDPQNTKYTDFKDKNFK
jgi:tetratricopeptide (TPR) repeat protein